MRQETLSAVYMPGWTHRWTVTGHSALATSWPQQLPCNLFQESVIMVLEMPAAFEAIEAAESTSGSGCAWLCPRTGHSVCIRWIDIGMGSSRIPKQNSWKGLMV